MKKNYLKTFIATLLMAVGSVCTQAQETFYSNDYEDGNVQWVTGTGGRFTPVIMDDDTKYMSVDQSTRFNNGTTLTSSETVGKVAAGNNFTFICRVKLGASNNQNATAFNIYDANNTKLLSIAEKSTNATDWTINDNAEQKAKVSAGGGKVIADLSWVNIQMTYKDGLTYLTLKDANNNVISEFDKTMITSTSTNGGLGKLEFVTSRYNANFAIDDIVVREVIDGDIPAAEPTTYTIKFVDVNNNILKTTEPRNTLVDATFTADAADMENFYSEDANKKYSYKSGNETKTAVEAAEENVITLVFDTYDKFSYTVTGKAGDTDLGTIASGEAYTDNKTVTYLNKYIKVGDKWYMTEAPYSVNITSETTEVTSYKEANIDYFHEIERLENTNPSTEGDYSGGLFTAVSGRNTASLGTFPAGKYIVTAYVVNNAFRGVLLRNTEDADITTNTIATVANSGSGEQSTEITLTKETTIALSGVTDGNNNYNQSADIDYIYIKKTGETVSLPYEYNTYCTQSALDFTGNEDVEAYTAEMNGEGTGVTLTQVYQVPKGAGVILKRKGEATTANVNIITSADELSGNQLKGVKTPMQAAELVAENAYILVDQLFCRVTESSEGELAAGKAYLAVPANVKAAATLSLGFGNITGATEVEAQAKATAGEIYNMQGMRVKSATKGIYIIGGKKYSF